MVVTLWGGWQTYPTSAQKAGNMKKWKFPLILRKEHEKIVGEFQRELNRASTRLVSDAEAHRKREEENKRRVDDLIQKVTRLDWDRNNRDVYRVTLSFDARLMYGRDSYEDLNFTAEMIARQLQHEIASSKFIEKADEAAVAKRFPTNYRREAAQKDG